MDTQSTAYLIGCIFGSIILLVVVLAVIGFGIFAIIKAFISKQKVWIILGSVFGLFGALIVIAGLVAFCIGVIHGIEESRTYPNGQIAPMHAYTGKNISYTIGFPANWEIKREKGDFDIEGNSRGAYVGVIAEEQDLGGYDFFTDTIKNGVTKNATDVQFSSLENVEIDHRRWCVLISHGKFSGIPFVHRFYFYTGKEGTYQIVCWTFENLFDKKAKEMETIVYSFKFPQS